ncbi:MAG: FHA domain-containing protein [Myxococcales bacterium]|nr:MAG: FHA domain-containing protein [Myxococcales bacterium]
MTSSRDGGDQVDTQNEGGRTVVRFWLEYQGNTLELRNGAVVVGRSSNCHIVLDDGLVSRRHAQFMVSAKIASIEDFGSVNGVYVNGERIAGQRALRDGDRVQIGKQDFTLRSATKVVKLETPPERFSAETLHGKTLPREVFEAEKVREELTRRTDALDLLCGVADKVLALGRGDEAEKLLGTALGNMLKQVQSGSALAPASAARAASYAVRIADATGRSRWVDYCFELYGAQSRPLPSEVVDQLYVVLRKITGVGLVGFRAYLEKLRAASSSFSPTDRFVLQRIEGLERLILR